MIIKYAPEAVSHLNNLDYVRITNLHGDTNVIEYENDGRNPWYYGQLFKKEVYSVNEDGKKIKDPDNKTGYRTKFVDCYVKPLNFGLIEDVEKWNTHKVSRMDSRTFEHARLNYVHWFI